eukprot:5827411-Prymnesium_polylepis.1
MHELGANDGGHADSINDILVTDGPTFEGRGDDMRCTAVTAASDGMLIVWDVGAGKALRRCSHGAAVTAMARVDEEFILSCGVDGQVREWRWRTGSQMRELFLSPSGVPLSSMSFHVPTNTLALGNRAGELCVWRVNPRNDNPDVNINCYPLTEWSFAGRDPPAHAAGPANEVAAIQHDGDKIVFALRSGIARVVWLGDMPDEGMPFGIYTSGRSVRRTSPFERPTAAVNLGIAWQVRIHPRQKPDPGLHDGAFKLARRTLLAALPPTPRDPESPPKA